MCVAVARQKLDHLTNDVVDWLQNVILLRKISPILSLPEMDGKAINFQ